MAQGIRVQGRTQVGGIGACAPPPYEKKINFCPKNYAKNALNCGKSSVSPLGEGICPSLTEILGLPHALSSHHYVCLRQLVIYMCKLT